MVTADKVLSANQLAKLIRKLATEKEKSVLTLKNSSTRRPKEVRNVVDYFLISLIANTGLRISEALHLQWSDIHFDFLVVRAEIAKNRKKGTVYFGPKTRALLDELQALKNGPLKRADTDLVFSLNGYIPSRSYVHCRFKIWIAAAGLPSHFSLHSLRHTYGTICLDKGLSLTFVRDQLRHSNIAITSQYLHLTKENREKVKDLF